jgi:mannose-6-phosphate isomerase-like protein (cupin superfamily)
MRQGFTDWREVRDQAHWERARRDRTGWLRSSRSVPTIARGLATFSLPPNAVSKAVAHRTVEEVWYITSGHGRMWRKLGEHEEIVEIVPGLSLMIPTGTHFQFCCEGEEALNAIGATMPPWPGESEAFFVEGAWQSTAQSDRWVKSPTARCWSNRATA